MNLPSVLMDVLPLLPLAAMGIGAAVGGIAGAVGDAKQANAAEDAQAQNNALIQQQMGNQAQAAYAANDLLAGVMPGVQDYMGQGYEAGADFATQGFGQQREDLLQSGQLGAGAINEGLGASTDALYGGAGQGINALTNRQDRAGGMLDQQGGLYGNYQADPGYEFRRKAGEDAIRNMQAARGGRFGGAAMKELVGYNQDMASQEFGNYMNRANSEFGARTSSDAQALNATSQAANMAYGAGQGAAGLYGNAAAQQADIYGRTGTQLGMQAAQAGQALGGMTQDYYGGLANMDYGAAQQMGQNLMAGASGGAGLTGAAMANNASTVPYAGSGWANAGNAVNTAVNAAVTVGALGGFGGSSGASGDGFGSGTAQNGPGLAVSLNPQTATADPGLYGDPAAAPLSDGLQSAMTAAGSMGYQQPAQTQPSTLAATSGTGLNALPFNPAILTRMGVR